VEIASHKQGGRQAGRKNEEPAALTGIAYQFQKTITGPVRISLAWLIFLQSLSSSQEVLTQHNDGL
jgi:hypothetical protein